MVEAPISASTDLETDVVEATAEQLGIQRAQEREQERRSHLSMRGRRARRSSVLTSRQYAAEGKRVQRAADRLGFTDVTVVNPLPQPEVISLQPDVGRAVRRAGGIRFAVGLGNKPYRREGGVT